MVIFLMLYEKLHAPFCFLRLYMKCKLLCDMSFSENQYIFMSPNRYIFKGGMVFPDDEDDSENPSYGSPSASSSGSPIGSADTADFANPVKIVGDSSGSGATSTYTVSQSVT